MPPVRLSAYALVLVALLLAVAVARLSHPPSAADTIAPTTTATTSAARLTSSSSSSCISPISTLVSHLVTSQPSQHLADAAAEIPRSTRPHGAHHSLNCSNGAAACVSAKTHPLFTRLRQLAALTDVPAERGTTRPFLSPASLRARDYLRDLFTSAGMSASLDPVGNVVGMLSCAPPSGSNDTLRARAVLALGSHFDTVRGAGMWDGVYGILGAVSVVEQLRDSICHLPFDVSIMAFDDEEGSSPFGTTNFGSKAVAGVPVLPPPAARAALSESFRAAFGKRLSPAVVSRARLRRAPLAFLELHIEQGPVLDRLRTPVGVVTAIAGQTRLRVAWAGTPAHAGTEPMAHRADALAAAAEAVLAVEAVANELALRERVVATVGQLDVARAATNVVASDVTMTVDVRAPTDELRHVALSRIRGAVAEIAARRRVRAEIAQTHDVPAVEMAPWLVDTLREAVGGVDLVSGAGHDAMFLSRVTDTAMIFVRCRDGVSHSPEEFVREQDALAGIDALHEAVLAVARRVASESA